MAVTINGTSGITTPGIINSGNETITGNTAITGILSVNGNNISPFPTFRNKIINGTIFFDQRNSGANTTLSTNNNVYTVDRWWGQVAANTTGSNNIAMGESALGANLVGVNNTAIGFDALSSWTKRMVNTIWIRLRIRLTESASRKCATYLAAS